MRQSRTDVRNASLMTSNAAALLIVILSILSKSQCRVIRDFPVSLSLPTSDKSTGCYFSVTEKNSSELAPLLLNPKQSSESRILYPGPDQDDIWIETGKAVHIFCPGQKNGVDGVNSSANFTSLPGVCEGDDILNFGFGTISSTDLACTKPPRSTAQRSGNTCAKDKTEILIGFPMSGRSFVPTISLCFDDDSKASLFSNYTVIATINASAKGVKRPSFDPGDFYEEIPVNDLYKKETQFETLSRILKSKNLAKTYIDPKSTKKFLARGHLAAKADFFYASQQKATFYHVNVAPQWGVFNSGNWASLEASVRDLAVRRRRDLQIYTGTFDIMSLPDINGDEQLLYLYFDENNNGAIPVPKLFWKLVYDPATLAGVVILGVNNPYMNPVSKDYLVCESVCSKIGWIDFDVRKIKKGYMYCCEIGEFRKTVGYLPDLPVEKLLT